MHNAKHGGIKLKVHDTFFRMSIFTIMMAGKTAQQSSVQWWESSIFFSALSQPMFFTLSGVIGNAPPDNEDFQLPCYIKIFMLLATLILYSDSILRLTICNETKLRQLYDLTLLQGKLSSNNWIANSKVSRSRWRGKCPKWQCAYALSRWINQLRKIL